MMLEQNLADLRMHAEHFATRQGFTCTVLDADTGEAVAWPFRAIDYDR